MKKELKNVIIKFAGDSGDGMQLAGALFSNATANAGNELATFPDFPAEIRAPKGTVSGVSGFQIHFGETGVYSPGDAPDVLIAMNPAALKANLVNLKAGCTIIIDSDSFFNRSIDKAGFTENPILDDSLDPFKVIEAPITNLTKTSIAHLGLDNKSNMRSKNMFALGMVFWLYNKSLEGTIKFFNRKFAGKPLIAKANVTVLKKGYNFAETIEALPNNYIVPPAKKPVGIYRNITGNQATAWGFLAAADKVNRNLFLGSYPITPASGVLLELTKHKWAGVNIFQAEDEIAGICAAIGASFAGNLAITTTSGPGMALKSEAIGLAVMTELPLVIVDIQRGGPSTGLPTKTEQSDLSQALYGRNGESPLVVLSASAPGTCFDMAFEAARIAVEHMTPVILLTEGYIANGSQPWKIKLPKDLKPIKPNLAENRENWAPYKRDAETLARKWVLPGTKGFEHRLGGLEKENITGNVSYEAANHAEMIALRAKKIARVALDIPLQKVKENGAKKLLVVGWGGQFGILFGAVDLLQQEGKDIAFTNFSYMFPLPKNTQEIFGSYNRIIVCELNSGQFANYLQAQFPEFTFERYNKIEGLPFKIAELKERFNQILEGE